MRKQHEGVDQESEQLSENNKIGGAVTQKTDAPHAKQVVKDTEATELYQDVEKQQGLRLGTLSARGLYAVLGLVLVVVVYSIVQYLASR